MAIWTTPDQRQKFYVQHLRGDTYQSIADDEGVSKECVRYWCRRQRDGGSYWSTYRREPGGLLSHFDPKVRYCVLRLRLEHPRWGPNRIRARLMKRPSLRGLALPSDSSIGRYLHQWPDFRRTRKGKTNRPRPKQPIAVHQRWQIDFKTNIVLADSPHVHLHTVRDPVGEVCSGASLFSVEQANVRTQRVPLEHARSTLRKCFAWWNTLPDEVQTDGEPTLVAQPGDYFPSTFTLWLKGLGIKHLVIRSGRPTDNAEVERCHRTINDYAIVGNENRSVVELQSILDEAVLELAFSLSSRAEGCAGQSPMEAHPELLEPRRSFRPEHELAHFDLTLVDAFLSTFTWTRKVGKTGQICLGGYHEYYSVGRAYARQEVSIRFDPADRHLVFYLPKSEETDEDGDDLQEIGRRPARNLEIEDLTGLIPWPVDLVPQQLPLPLFLAKGVYC